MSLFDTSVASECDAKVAEMTLGSKMLPFVEEPPILELKPHYAKFGNRQRFFS